MSPLDFDPFTQTVSVSSGREDEELTVAQIFAAGRGAPVTELEPALVLALSLTDHPHQIAQLGHVSEGTAGYVNDPRLRELTHRALIAALAGSGTLPTGWQKLAERMAAGLDVASPAARLHAAAGIRTALGVPSSTDRLIFPDDSPAQVLGEIASELATPQTAVESFPAWLGALGPLIATPATAAAVVLVFARIPRGDFSTGS